MKEIYLSSIGDESQHILELASKFNTGIEILGFTDPFFYHERLKTIDNTNNRLVNIERRAMHGPFVDLFTISVDPEIRKLVMKRYIEAYQAAKALNVKHLIFHAGFVPKGFFPSLWLQNSISFWEEFFSFADDDVQIHIENVCEEDHTLIGELVDRVARPNFNVCLDIGHVNVNSSASLESWIKGLNCMIGYVHLHNNDGIRDGHRGINNGTINIAETLELLEKYAPNAKWSLETKLEETEESILLMQKLGYI